MSRRGEGTSEPDVAAVGARRAGTPGDGPAAHRAGATCERYASNLNEIAWWEGNSGGRTHPVGYLTPNGFGLHDFLGNVREWVQDGFGDYSGVPETDPEGDTSAWFGRVFRGGSWFDESSTCRAGARGGGIGRFSYVGFRLARTGSLASGTSPT